ncbi:MAG: hypothetical protein ACRBCI_15615, partial [Cellvibrionaceae bacterium]
MVPCEGRTSNQNTSLNRDISNNFQDIDFDELLGTLANWNNHIEHHFSNVNEAPEKIGGQL